METGHAVPLDWAERIASGRDYVLEKAIARVLARRQVFDGDVDLAVFEYMLWTEYSDMAFNGWQATRRWRHQGIRYWVAALVQQLKGWLLLRRALKEFRQALAISAETTRKVKVECDATMMSLVDKIRDANQSMRAASDLGLLCQDFWFRHQFKLSASEQDELLGRLAAIVRAGSRADLDALEFYSEKRVWGASTRGDSGTNGSGAPTGE